MIGRFFNRGLDANTLWVLAIILAAGLLIPALNLWMPVTSALHIPSYLVPLLGKYLCYALLALSVGLILAQSNWAINYWRTDVFRAAVSQLLVFYALVGLANQYLIDRLNRRVLIEFAVVMLIALILLLRGR